MSLFVAGTAFPDILIDSRSAKSCIFPSKMRLQDGTRKVSEAVGARWHLELKNLRQAQYLVKLEGGSCCSAIVLDVSCETDQA